jgi:LysR family transcriptional activator of nhaA
MEWLNYHHLLYFWAVAREGSIVRASTYLRLAQPTISKQISVLEEAFGEQLFTRVGRNLILTDFGRLVYRYADEIFALGRELSDTVRGRPVGRPLRLAVGVTDVLPKLIAYHLLEPALHLAEPVQLICREGKLEGLLTDLVSYSLDVVLADTPVSPIIKVRAFNHLLGECGVTFLGSPALVAMYAAGFPGSLDNAPILLPTMNTSLRQSLDHWFEAVQVHPQVMGEYEDSALLKVFGQRGLGIFALPSVIAADVQQQYGVGLIGQVDAIHERFYAITVERRLKHPAVVAIAEAAHSKLFSHASEPLRV